MELWAPTYNRVGAPTLHLFHFFGRFLMRPKKFSQNLKRVQGFFGSSDVEGKIRPVNPETKTITVELVVSTWIWIRQSFFWGYEIFGGFDPKLKSWICDSERCKRKKWPKNLLAKTVVFHGGFSIPWDPNPARKIQQQNKSKLKNP